MSVASKTFAGNLLAELGISVVFEDKCGDEGTRENPSPFPWVRRLENGEEHDLTESEATEEFRLWLQNEWLGTESLFSIKQVTGVRLPELRTDKFSTSGMSDFCVLEKNDEKKVQKSSLLQAAFGIIEIKKKSVALKDPQMQLQLVALSRINTFGKGVVLLGTDGDSKWCILRFSKYNEVAVQYFNHGRKCLEEYESLLSNVKERRTELANAEEQDVANKRARLSAIPEDGAVFHRMAQGHLTGLPNAAAAIEEEQDLSGFVDVLDDERDKAIETELYLRRLANCLGDMAGGKDHRPVLPEWSLAKNRIPSYYS